MAYIYSQINQDKLKRRINYPPIEPLGAEKPLTLKDIRNNSHITASMSVENIIYVLKNDAQVILARRCWNSTLFIGRS
jgi:hypothetical protein